MQLKVALHVHTTRSDGSLEPTEVIQNHIDAGFDAVCITDHDVEPGGTASRNDILISWGSERGDIIDGEHVGQIPGEKSELLIWNHPNREDNGPSRVNRIAREKGVEAVELSEHGRPYFQYLECSLPKIVSDDSHTSAGVSDSYIIVEVEERSWDAIIQAIKAGQFRRIGPEYTAYYLAEFCPSAMGGFVRRRVYSLMWGLWNYLKTAGVYIRHWWYDIT